MAYTPSGASTKSASGPRGNMSAEIQTLLDAASMHGGSLAEVAAELTHPERSILATASSAIRNSFVGTMKVLNTSLNIVAGAISQDYTIGEAMKEGLTVSDALLGDMQTEGAMRVPDYIVRFAIDVLADPLTYVTFGAGRVAIIGTSALPKVALGEKVALKLGKEAGDLKMLSKPGETLYTKMKQFFENPKSVKLDDMEKTIVKEISGERNDVIKKAFLETKEEEIVARHLAEGKVIDNDAIAKELQQIADSTTTRKMEDEILTGRINEDFSKRSLTRMMEYNPDLANTLLDRGGIKVFNKSILSGQRIRDIGRAIPGMSTMDKLTAPMRAQLGKVTNLLGRAFDPAMTKAGKAQEGAIDLIKGYKHILNSKDAATFEKYNNLVKSMDVSEGELNMLVSAIENIKRPADPKSAALWDVANGIRPDSNIISDDLINAAGFVKNQFKEDVRILRKAGIQVSEQSNYIRHFVKEDVKVEARVAKKGFGVDEQKMAKMRRFIDEDGNEIYGWANIEKTDAGDVVTVRGPKDDAGKNPIVLKATLINKEQLKTRIADKMHESITLGYNKIDEVRAEVNNIMKDIQGSFDKKTLGQFASYISKAENMDATTKRYLLKHLAGQTQALDIGAMVEQRLATSYKDGVKIKQDLDNMSDVDLETLLKKISSKENVDTAKIKEFNKMLKKAIKDKKTAKKSAATKAGEAIEKPKVSLKEFEDKIAAGKGKFNEAQSALIEQELDPQKIGEIIGMLKKDFSVGLEGSARRIDSIINRQQKIAKIFDQTELDRLSGIKQYQDVDKLIEGNFIDEVNNISFKSLPATIKQARDLTVDLETNILAISLRNHLEVTRSAVSTELTKDFSRNFGKLASEAPENWRPINFAEFNTEGKKVNFDDMLQGKNGEKLVFHPANAEYFERMFKGMVKDDVEEMMGAYDKLQNVFKASATSIWPMFHGRNAISNVMLNYMNIGADALSPSINAASFNMMSKTRKYAKLTEKYESLINHPVGSAGFENAIRAKEEMAMMSDQILFTDKQGYKWTFGELHKEIKQNIIAFNPGIVGQVDIEKTFQQNIEDTLDAAKVKGIKANVKQNVKGLFTLDTDKITPIKVGKEIGSAIEDYGRLTSFFGNLKRSGDVKQAVARTKEFLFDYSNITDFEKRVLKRAIPFYTFTRKNMELQVRTLMKEPGKIATEMRGIMNLGEAITSDEQLSPEEMAMLPDWMKQGVVALKARKGKDIEILSGLETPTEAMFKQLQPANTINMISPIIKYPVEAMTGYSFFRQKPISDITDATVFRAAPEWLKSAIGYTEVPLTKSDGTKIKGADGKQITLYKSLRPNVMYNIMNFPFTARAVSFFDKATSPGSSLDDRLSYGLTGITTRQVNLDVESKKREQEVQAELEKALQDAGLGYTFKRFSLKK